MPTTRVLDIGAGVDKPLQSQVLGAQRQYFTLDSDSQGDFDFHSFDDMATDLTFDLMVAHQLLEHLDIEVAFGMLNSAYQHLTAGGYFVASVPNMAHPVRYWADATHVTHWPFSDLYGFFRNAGFDVPNMYRYTKVSRPRNPIKRYIINTVCDTLRIDWCDSLMIVGQKPIDHKSVNQ